MRVLVIDNDFDLLDNIRIILEMAGYAVIQADNGLEGIRLAHEQKPSLIICDVMMPEMNGYEVLEELQANSATAIIPFIFLTSKSDLEDIRRGMLAGADDYLTKPFTEAALLKAIQKRLEKRQRLELEQRIQFSQALVQKQEADLASISQQLEDKLRQKLLHLQYWATSQSNNPNASKEMLFEAVHNSLDEILAGFNPIAYHIYPAMLRQLGLILSLQWYFSNLRERSKQCVKFETYNMEKRLVHEAELSFYRIVQRLLDSLDYSAEEIYVVLWLDEQTIHLSLTQLPVLDAQVHWPLFQLLEEYAQAIQASLFIRHDENATAVHLSLPNAAFQSPRIDETPKQPSNTRQNKAMLKLDSLLTLREREILELILADLTHADIATKLVISPRTVEKHRANIMQKLGLNTHTELILFAMRHGLIAQS